MTNCLAPDEDYAQAEKWHGLCSSPLRFFRSTLLPLPITSAFCCGPIFSSSSHASSLLSSNKSHQWYRQNVLCATSTTYPQLKSVILNLAVSWWEGSEGEKEGGVTSPSSSSMMTRSQEEERKGGEKQKLNKNNKKVSKKPKLAKDDGKEEGQRKVEEEKVSSSLYVPPFLSFVNFNNETPQEGISSSVAPVIPYPISSLQYLSKIKRGNQKREGGLSGIVAATHVMVMPPVASTSSKGVESCISLFECCRSSSSSTSMAANKDVDGCWSSLECVGTLPDAVLIDACDASSVGVVFGKRSELSLFDTQHFAEAFCSQRRNNNANRNQRQASTTKSAAGVQPLRSISLADASLESYQFRDFNLCDPTVSNQPEHCAYLLAWASAAKTKCDQFLFDFRTSAGIIQKRSALPPAVFHSGGKSQWIIGERKTVLATSQGLLLFDERKPTQPCCVFGAGQEFSQVLMTDDDEPQEQQIGLGESDEDVKCVSSSWNENSKVLFGVSGTQITLWDLRTETLKFVHSGHYGQVLSVTLMNGGRAAMSTATDCQLQLWSVPQ